MSEPIVIAAMIGGIFTLAGSFLAIIIAVLNRRDNAAQAASSAATAAAQNSLIERLQVDQGRSDHMTTRLQERVDVLERADGEKDARITVLTEWGRWSSEDPPRTPPPWIERGQS